MNPFIYLLYNRDLFFMNDSNRGSNYISINEELSKWYSQNNIVFEKNKLFYEFFIVLFENINNTYLGIDCINNTEDITAHFNWCYNQTIKKFNDDGIYFKTEGPLYDYLYYFFTNSYYQNPNDENINNIHEFFTNLFTFGRIKTKSELETYNFLYKLFDISLKN